MCIDWMATLQDHFSIADDFKRVKDILDAKAIQGVKSRWICKLILEAYDREEKAQTTFDKIIEKQRIQDEKNRRLEDFIIMVDRDIDEEKIAADYNDEEIIKIYKRAEKLALMAKKALRINAPRIAYSNNNNKE